MALIILLCSLCSAQEIKRPTADADAGAAIALGCTGTNIASTALTFSYDAAGLATFSTLSTSGSASATRYRTRSFSTWQTTGNTYSALSLNVNSESGGASGNGEACVYYSVNSGGAWTKVRCDSDGSGAGWTQRTDTVTLTAAQDLTKIKVGVCTRGDLGGFSDNILLYDIWTSGTVSTPAPPAGTGNTSGMNLRRILFVF